MITTVPILYHIQDALAENIASQLFRLLAQVVLCASQGLLTISQALPGSSIPNISSLDSFINSQHEFQGVLSSFFPLSLTHTTPLSATPNITSQFLTGCNQKVEGDLLSFFPLTVTYHLLGYHLHICPLILFIISKHFIYLCIT